MQISRIAAEYFFRRPGPRTARDRHHVAWRQLQAGENSFLPRQAMRSRNSCAAIARRPREMPAQTLRHARPRYTARPLIVIIITCRCGIAFQPSPACTYLPFSCFADVNNGVHDLARPGLVSAAAEKQRGEARRGPARR